MDRSVRGAHRSETSAVYILALALAVSSACGGNGEEAALEEASAALVEVRADVETARTRVEERKARVRDAQADLEAAEVKLRQARTKLAQAESKLDQRATDAALFRAIQRRLLEDDALDDVAIAANVARGVVTLSGSVSDLKERDRALEIARGVPGVAQVIDRIEAPAVGAAPK